ncbi:TetR/AcrR family transcriptional regulator [Campylobacter sp. faydin G-24]|uniref:TetR/AcrR family transcriptional regulator n=1 Tax=Campylobacter anatolicus TaxID=2829105 RepID=A0ABS5HI95_9BACT|nr:TetR/AcrR family transcriptional regulator [Campylobacter anatolicus]MBR8463994.1 TetR/AcrR family transcriptional regulator [Campylobacter anatolicus]
MKKRVDAITSFKKEIANKINISIQTLYNWEISKPNLYNLILSYYKKDLQKVTPIEQELLNHFRKLDETSQEIIATEIKLKALKQQNTKNL